jgi:hypothetical protein
MIDRSPLRLERSSESLTHGVDAKRRPEGSRHGEGQAFAPEFRQRGVPRERTWECARTHQGRATGRGGNYGGPGPCRAFALLQERARAPPPPTLAHGTTSERPDRRPDHDCFAMAERKSAEPMPRRLVLVQRESELGACQDARISRNATTRAWGITPCRSVFVPRRVGMPARHRDVRVARRSPLSDRERRVGAPTLGWPREASEP